MQRLRKYSLIIAIAFLALPLNHMHGDHSHCVTHDFCGHHSASSHIDHDGHVHDHSDILFSFTSILHSQSQDSCPEEHSHPSFETSIGHKTYSPTKNLKRVTIPILYYLLEYKVSAFNIENFEPPSENRPLHLLCQKLIL